MLLLPQYEGLESSYEDIVYSFMRRQLSSNNYTIRIKKSGYIEIDSIIPSIQTGKTGEGKCDGYIFNSNSAKGLCALLELKTTGKIQEGIEQVRTYARGFTISTLSKEQQLFAQSLNDLKLISFDGKSLYLSIFNIKTKDENILINKVNITSSNAEELNKILFDEFPKTNYIKKINEDDLVKKTARIIRGHEKLQKNTALIMSLLASIYGATNEINYKVALEIIDDSQSSYDLKLNETYKNFLKELSDKNDIDKMERLYKDVAVNLYNLSKDQGIDLYGFIYEELASKERKKEQGEYYTPRHTIRPILKSVFDNYLGWNENELKEKIVLDPFCGSGGFLYEYIEHIKKKFTLTNIDIDIIAGESLWGFDKNNILAAYLNLFLAGDGSANVFRVKTSINWRKYFLYNVMKTKGKKQEELIRINDEISAKFALKQNLADINHHIKMLAKDVQITERDLENFFKEDSPIESFILNKLGLKSSNKDEKYLGNVDLLITNVPYGKVTEEKEQFIEHGKPIYGAALESNALRECIDYLKPEVKQGNRIIEKGGVCIAIIPDSILENSSEKKIRDYLISRCTIHAIIGLPPFTFSPYAMEKTYAIVFQKLAPEDFNYSRELDEVFFYDSISDGKANSKNRYKTDHIDKFTIKDLMGNEKKVNTYIHNDFDPCFESFDTSSYSYLSKLEWAWKKDFANLNKEWDQKRLTEVWKENEWIQLPGKKWGYYNLQRSKRSIQKEIKNDSLILKIKRYLDLNKIKLSDFNNNFIDYKEEILQSDMLDSNEHNKLLDATLIEIIDNKSFILFQIININDIDLIPSSFRYLGVRKEKLNFDKHLSNVKDKTYSSMDKMISEFAHDFTSDTMTSVRLGTEFTIIQGTQFSKKDAYQHPGDIAVFTAATNGPAYYVSENIPNKVMIVGPSLIWARKGAKAGTIQKYEKKISRTMYAPFYISDVSGIIKPYKEKLKLYDLDFIMIYIAGLVKHERQSEANNAQLNKTKLENLHILLPSIEIQISIGKKVRKLNK
ncbi:MAG: hypothetical protein DRG78_04035 [Epsilonproteobacteria bacterium]|nr:MAG: hypothetical protein DRG78_04035 [Campylobacterota bacterium]